MSKKGWAYVVSAGSAGSRVVILKEQSHSITMKKVRNPTRF
jgi:hypothetical protein